MITMGSYVVELRGKLNAQYSDNEANSIVFILLEEFLGYSKTDIVLCADKLLSVSDKNRIELAMKRVVKNEPIQYVIGHTHFCGLKIKVDKRVMIPRPETEELVQWVIDDAKNTDIKILDIGTGSGCIPIALKHNLPRAEVSSIDVSEEAISLATANAQANKAEIAFIQADVLSPDVNAVIDDHFDIIISNPPYIEQKEAANMAENVLLHEPHQALFVKDGAAMIFYEAIASLAMTCLNPGGKLYFEISEFYSDEVVELLQSKGFIQVELKRDIHDKNRMVSGVKT